jgi:hypothetical protein
MYDPIARALQLLDVEAPRKEILVQPDPMDPRRRSYVVPTGNGRKQIVWLAPVPDAMFRERLDMLSVSVRDLQADAPLLTGLLGIARDLRRARLCLVDGHLAVAASFIPEEIVDGVQLRLIAALREVAAVADAIEAQLVGADIN